MKLQVKAAGKAIVIIAVLLLFTLASLCVGILPFSRSRRRSLRVKSTSFFARIALRVLGVRIAVHRARRPQARRAPYLIVSNHLSYIDILVIASRMPAVFITSVELRHTFPLGMLAALGGSLFVERRNPHGLKKEIDEIAGVLEAGQSVVLFPEGTTSNGDSVRPFRNSLLTAAITTGTSVLPVCIRYTHINGNSLDTRSRESVYYHGGTTFFEHVPRLLSLTTVAVELLVLKPIRVRPRTSRKELAQESHAAVLKAYQGRRNAQRTQKAEPLSQR